MKALDEYFGIIAELVEEIRQKNGRVRKLFAPSESGSLSTFLSGSYPGIVLKSDTFLELGSPSTASSLITLYTNNPDLCKDGEITLIGPDVQEATSSELPFGQVIMVAGRELGDNDYYELLKYTNISNLISGYMIKSTSENIWSRISYEAAERGFRFALLGAALMRRIKTQVHGTTSMSVIFVTSSKEDVLRLQRIGANVKAIAQRIKAEIWKDRGVDILECNLDGHCGLCKNASVCQTIYEMSK